ncbi:hypothetical protein PIB30_057850 [Stylosanthes scabra]|uniref:Uncharacterized protein n=1 Tax=Stylosanthes scabra TaxID=79078 RepID=A0ABU6WJN0_9FABA|nr:hypothetical protein [Stylosanthes scabra]
MQEISFRIALVLEGRKYLSKNLFLNNVQSVVTSPRLVVLWAKASPPSPTPPPLPTPSLPPKKRPIIIAALVSPLLAGKGTSKISAKPIHRHSQRIAARGGPSTATPKEKVFIEISSDGEPEPKPEDTIRKVVEMDEDPEEDPKEAPLDTEVEEGPEDDPEEEQYEVEEHFHREDDYGDYWQLEDSDSENVLGDDPCFWNYDDLFDLQHAKPADSSVGSCTEPPPANL